MHNNDYAAFVVILFIVVGGVTNHYFYFLVGCSEIVDTHMVILQLLQIFMYMHDARIIEDAFQMSPNGGLLRPICNRRIGGFKCRCYARYVVVDNIQYWKIYYRINQRLQLLDDEHDLMKQMYRIAKTMIALFEKSGQQVIIYQNIGYRDKADGKVY